jgi:arylsulfatase A-like enzyme
MYLEETKGKKPNIIYILGYDHRGDIMKNMGHPVVETPNLDKLAEKGVLFKNAFCTSPICTPSRTCHYLGQWERKHGINFNSNSSVSPNAWENSFPIQLKKQGYFVGWVGKNHVPIGQDGYESGYMEKVFDYWYGNHEHTGFYPKERAVGKIYKNSKYETQAEIFGEGVSNFLSPQKEFIETCSHPLPYRPEDKPFCLCLTFNLPHSASTWATMEMRPTDDALYRTEYRDIMHDFEMPKTYMSYDESFNKPRIPKEIYNGRYLTSYDYVRTPNMMREQMVRVYQTVTGMDRMIGKMMDQLEELGIADNTIIIFSTDHGIHWGEHGIGGKCFLYEEDIHIPMIIYDPRMPDELKGQVREEMALVPDLAPTVFDLTGCSMPDTLQGDSLVPLITNENCEWRDEFFAEQLMDIQNYPKSECIRTKEWKYIRYFPRTEDPEQEDMPFRSTLDSYEDFLYNSTKPEFKPVFEELFNLKDDPYEETNLAGKQEYNEIMDDMRKKIIAHTSCLKEGSQRPDTLINN